MKYCGNCGAELGDTVKFCASCGAKRPERAADAPKGTNRNQILSMIIGAVVVIAVSMAVILAVRSYSSPEQQLLRAIETRDYALAMSIISENEAIGQSARLLGKINGRIAELQTAYEKETLEYEAVCAELEEIEQLGIRSAAKQMEASRQRIDALYRERNLAAFYLCTSQEYVVNEHHQSTTTWDYDEQGRLTGYRSRAEYDDSGIKGFDYSLHFSYGDSGKIGEVMLKSGIESGTWQATYMGDLLSEYNGVNNGEESTIRFSYDANDKMTSVEIIYDGVAEQVTQLRYYDNGVLKERRDCDGFTTIKRYDENGRLSEEIGQFEDGSCAYRNVYGYNEQGMMTYQAEYSGDAIAPYMTTYREYDAAGRLTAISGKSDAQSFYASGEWDDSNQKAAFHYMNGADEIRIVLEYDEAGNIIRSTHYANEELQAQTTYTYIVLQLPLDYEKPDLSNPQYLISIL